MVRGVGTVQARRTRGIHRAAAGRVPRDASPSGATGPGGPGALVPAHGDGQQRDSGAPRPPARRPLKNLRVRSRLLLLVIIPTVTAVAAGGVFIASSAQSALVYQRVQTLASLSGKITGLVQALQNE